MEWRDVAQIITFAGLVAFGGWEYTQQEDVVEALEQAEVALAQIQLAHEGITAKQVQLCANRSKELAEAEAGFVPVGRERCAQFVKNWQESKPVPPQYQRLLAGWAFGGYDPPSPNQAIRSGSTASASSVAEPAD